MCPETGLQLSFNNRIQFNFNLITLKMKTLVYVASLHFNYCQFDFS